MTSGESPQIAEGAQDSICGAIEQALHRHRVHDGFAPQRASLAVQCNCAGLTAEDIDLLAEGLAAQRKRTSDSLPAIMASILADPKQARERVADMRRGAALRAKSRKVYPGESGWRQPCSAPAGASAEDSARWALQDLRGKVRAMVKGDRKTPAQVAEILGVTESEVARLLG